jgi:hypothetical protein
MASLGLYTICAQCLHVANCEVEEMFCVELSCLGGSILGDNSQPSYMFVVG